MLRSLGKAIYRVIGWRLEGELPPLAKFVIIGAPHTSTIDSVVFLAGVAALEVDLRFMAKVEILRGPWGPIFRRFGAIAIDRSRSNNVVEQLSRAFAENERFILALGPEGTRKYRPYWKSGFYHIALAAGVPVVPIGIHFREKRVIIGPPIDLSGDVRADMDRLRAFFAANSSGKRDDLVSPMRLREEDEPAGPEEPGSGAAT